MSTLTASVVFAREAGALLFCYLSPFLPEITPRNGEFLPADVPRDNVNLSNGEIHPARVHF
jgi:hypothetical protein